MRRIYFRAIAIAAVCLGSFYFLYDYISQALNSCASTPDIECINAAIDGHDFVANSQSVGREFYIAEDLIEAGHFEKGTQLLLHLHNAAPSHEITAANVVLTFASVKLAEEALSKPARVVGFELLDALRNPESALGAIIAKRYDIIQVEYHLYKNLLWYLMKDAGAGGGVADYVRYIDQAGKARFKPSATWRFLVDRLMEISRRSGDEHSPLMADIAYRVFHAGLEERAYEILKASTPTAHNKFEYLFILHHLGKYEEAQQVRRQFGIPADVLLARAKHEVSLQEVQKAAATIERARQAILKTPKQDMSLRQQLQSLQTLSEISLEIARQDLALDIVDQIISIERRTPFNNPAEWSTLYRSIGYPDKAMQVMQQFVPPLKSPCSPFSDLKLYAEEFFHLGRIDLAAATIDQTCDKGAVFGSMFGIRTYDLDVEHAKLLAWSPIYEHAVKTGGDTTEIVNYAGEGIAVFSSRYLAMHYLNRGDKPLGEDYLERAIRSEGPVTFGDCELAHLANAANRADLLEIYFARAIRLVSTKFRGAERIDAYLTLSRCHNLIRIDRLRLQH